MFALFREDKFVGTTTCVTLAIGAGKKAEVVCDLCNEDSLADDCLEELINAMEMNEAETVIERAEKLSRWMTERLHPQYQLQPVRLPDRPSLPTSTREAES